MVVQHYLDGTDARRAQAAGLLKRARGTLLRRATDPWEATLGGIVNTLVPEPEIPSHQGPDAQTVDPDLDVVTMDGRGARRPLRICTTLGRATHANGLEG